MLGLKKFKGDGGFICGDLTIHKTANIKEIDKGQSINGVSCSGEQKIYEVRGDGIKLDLGYTTWANGEKDIRTAYSVKGPVAIRRLERGLRLQISPPDNARNGQVLDYVILKQARVKIETFNKWSTLCKANREELDRGSGLDSFKILESAGALYLGTKEELFGATDRNRSFLCAKFEMENKLFPAVAFVITRVLPLINEYPAR